MSIVLDLILLAIFVIAVISCWRRGFVRSLMRFVSLIGAIIITRIFYPVVSGFLHDNLFFGKISGYIRSVFERDVGSTGKSVSDLFSELPEFFVKFLNRFSTQQNAEGFYNHNPNATPTQLSDYMAEPISRTISNVVAIVGLFLVSYILLKLLTLLIDRLVSIPLLNGLNHGLGIVFGVVLGIALVWVASILFHALVPKLASLFPKVFNDRTFDNTLIAKNMYSFNLFKALGLFKF